MHILNNLDLHKNQLLNTVFENLAVQPASPVKGQVYFNSETNTLKVWSGTKWLNGGTEEIPALIIANITGLQSALDGKVDTSRVLTDVPVNAKFTDTIATKASVGLGNADNTSDLAKPISTATQAALELKESIANVNTKTAIAETNAKAYADNEIGKLLGSGTSAALDTLKELAEALGNDPNFAATITGMLGLKTEIASSTIGNGIATNFVVNHSLNSKLVQVQIRQTGSPFAVVYTDVEITTANSITVKFARAPLTNEYLVTVVGKPEV